LKIKIKFMAGRGDNNKHGTSGQGSSNQSNQPFVTGGEKESASNHSRKQTGGSPSVEQSKTSSPDVERITTRTEDKVKPLRTDERTFNLMVDSVPYLVKVMPFTFNDEVRFYITVNGGEQHVFTWDSEVRGLRAIDDGAAMIPSALEEEISQKLQSGSGG
jgi:hypothetical protein